MMTAAKQIVLADTSTGNMVWTPTKTELERPTTLKQTDVAATGHVYERVHSFGDDAVNYAE